MGEKIRNQEGGGRPDVYSCLTSFPKPMGKMKTGSFGIGQRPILETSLIWLVVEQQRIIICKQR
jgi:hypothetical protein